MGALQEALLSEFVASVKRERVAQAGYVGHADSSVATQFDDSLNVSRLTRLYESGA